MCWIKPYYKFITILFLVGYITLIGNDVLARSNFKMTVPSLTFGLSYDFDNEERTGPNIDREDTAHDFTERLQLITSGWVYHPALFDFDLKIRPRWNQSIEKFSSGDKNKSRSFSLGFDTIATILKRKPYSFSLFANRGISTTSSNFIEKSKSEGISYGAYMSLKRLWLPGKIRYVHSDSTQTGRFNVDKENDKLNFDAVYDKYAGKSKLRALISDTRTTIEGRRTDIKQKTVEFSNSYRLKENGKAGVLGTRFSFNNTEGTFTQLTRYNISESLNLNHGGNVSTNYLLRYNSNESATSRSENGNLRFTLSHMLYENLKTTVRANTRISESSGTEKIEYGGGVSFGYNRRIPWGKLNISVGQNYRKNETNRKDDNVEVSGEEVVLTTGEITLLKKSFINVGSIRVMNPVSMAPYENGTDYTLTAENDRVMIRCELGGQIHFDFNCDDGASVVVDYTYKSRGVDFANYSRNYGLSLNLWSFLRMYYRFSRNTRRYTSSFVSREPVNSETRSIGAEIRLKNSSTNLTYKIKDPSGFPTEELGVREKVTFRPYRNIYLGLNGFFNQIRFMNTDRKEFFKGIAGNMQVFVSRRSRLNISGFGNQVEGDFVDNLRYGFSAEYEMRFRRLRGSMTYAFSEEDDKINFQRIKNHSFSVNVKTVRF
jgi:hypothetical protein